MLKWVLAVAALGALGVFVALQLVPYGRAHANPPVRQEPGWNSAETRALAVRACYDCHSNETAWPWYSNIAPFSWLVQRDVDSGRRALNFSEWDQPQDEADDAAETVQDREMPPERYVPLHPRADLSAAEREALIRGLTATLSEQDEREAVEEPEEAEEAEEAEDEGGRGRGRGRGRD